MNVLMAAVECKKNNHTHRVLLYRVMGSSYSRSFVCEHFKSGDTDCGFSFYSTARPWYDAEGMEAT